MGAVVGAHHVGLQVEDLERSIDFYTRRLGLEVTLRRTVTEPYIGEIVGYPGVEIREAFLSVPGSDQIVELLEYAKVERRAVDPATAHTGTAHVCLLVDDLPELYARLSEDGVRFLSPPVAPSVGPNQGGLVVYLVDPDGIRVELIQLP
ncbi:MAG: VOC family protein [Actinobacteria bacterium]|nr:VOC family protein [Actinomycetota bacterium]